MKKGTKQVISYITAIITCASMFSVLTCNAFADEVVSDKEVSETIEDTSSSYSDELPDVPTSIPEYDKSFFGYDLPSDYSEYQACNLSYRMSLFDTFVIDDGYSLADIVTDFSFTKSNHFKATGKWKDNIEWTYDHGVLTISGTGEIERIHGPGFNSKYCDRAINLLTYPWYREVYPWSSFGNNISEIIVSDGITDIPTCCFSDIKSGVKKITFGKDVQSIKMSAIDFYNSEDDGETVDIYFPEQATITDTVNNAFCGCNKKIVIHGYENSPIYYYIKNGKASNFIGDNVVFESLGKAANHYANSGSGGYLSINLDYNLDVANKTLNVTWEDEEQLDCSVSTKVKPEITNGVIDSDKIYEYYIENIKIQDGVKSITNLFDYYNLKKLFLPDSINKLPSTPDLLGGDIPNLTIIANTGTYAESYAKENGINFIDAKEYSEEPTVTLTNLGDLNLDGKVGIDDAVILNKYLVDSAVLTEQGKLNADCDKDGSITAADSLRLLEYLVGSINEL